MTALALASIVLLIGTILALALPNNSYRAAASVLSQAVATALVLAAVIPSLTNGASIRDVALPESFSALAEARTIVNPVERARAMAHEWNTNRTLISPGLTRQIEEGLSIPHGRYVVSLKRMKECRDLIPAVFGDCDVLLTPCVTGEAPLGLQSTGDTRFQEFWTALHTPAITLATHKGPKGLPIGIQLVGRIYDDEMLLSIARWAAERLA